MRLFTRHYRYFFIGDTWSWLLAFIFKIGQNSLSIRWNKTGYLNCCANHCRKRVVVLITSGPVAVRLDIYRFILSAVNCRV